MPQDMQQDSAPGMSMLQVVSIVNAYRKHALIIAAIVIVCTAAFAKMLPKTYTATATLMVSSDQRDPMAAAQTQQEPIGPFMSTEIQLIQSPAGLLAAVD